MDKPVPEETLTQWEEAARKIQTGPYPNGITQEAVKFAGVAAFAIPDLVAEVRRLRSVLEEALDALNEQPECGPNEGWTRQQAMKRRDAKRAIRVALGLK